MPGSTDAIKRTDFGSPPARTYWVYYISPKLLRHGWRSSSPLCFLRRFLGRKVFFFYGLLHYSAKPRLWQRPSCLLPSSHSSAAPGSWPGRPRARRSQTLRLSQCLPQCFTPPLTFWLLSCFVCLAKHFISKRRPAPQPLTFPFVETEQSFTNHRAECKISKPFDIAGLMKWLALLCCNYWERSAP